MPFDFVSTNTAQMTLPDGKKMELLWGDRVEVISQTAAIAQVRARGKEGAVDRSSLNGQSLLEIYVIDVGQGDGILIRTPDHRHILIDGGYNRAKQPGGKNAADFVDWKFFRDYRMNHIELDAMIASHCDADHYGGLWDLLNPDEEARAELDLDDVRVENFYHAGIGWWIKTPNGRWLGESTPDGKFLTQLMGSRTQVQSALQAGADPKLQGEWAKFLSTVVQTKRKNGSPTTIQRLSHTNAYLPGFEPAPNKAAIRVLAPVEFTVNGKPALHRYASTDSINTNGNSIVLRVDYGKTRILLTGDLNKESHHALLADYEGELHEFACDVAKACHHGSHKVSYRFLMAMQPAVTVISSGDNESHDHPRPEILAASATTGFLQLDANDDRLISPLIYATELARSLKLGKPKELMTTSPDNQNITVKNEKLAASTVKCDVVEAGALNPSTKIKNLDSHCRFVTGTRYGLVNIRTDGEKILCAILNEAKDAWQISTIRSRF
jgi:beta-lactamase superfamily II metal-dependent hydrolase